MSNVASTSKSGRSKKGVGVPWARKYKAILRDHKLEWLDTHSAKEESEVVQKTLKAVQHAHGAVGDKTALLEDLEAVRI